MVERLAVLWALLCVAIAAGASPTDDPLGDGGTAVSYNYNGEVQELGDSDNQHMDLGELRELGDSRPETQHEVISLYEEHHWGWPSKESPEMMVPGTWQDAPGGANKKTALKESAEDKPAKPKTRAPPGKETPLIPRVHGKVTKAYKAGLERKAAAQTTTFAPGAAIKAEDKAMAAAAKLSVSSGGAMTEAQADAKLKQLGKGARPPHAPSHAQSKAPSPSPASAPLPKQHKESTHGEIVYDMDSQDRNRQTGIMSKRDVQIQEQEAAKHQKEAASNTKGQSLPTAVSSKDLRTMWRADEAKKEKAQAAEEEKQVANRVLSPAQADKAIHKLAADAEADGTLHDGPKAPLRTKPNAKPQT